MIAAIPLITSALSMFAPSAPLASAAAGAAAQSAASAATDFSQVMSKVASDTLHSVEGAEKLSISGIEGKASVQSVVESVMTAQENLQTALAVRDKAVAAFQEITRMSI